jgi:hypothetical protein
MPSKTRRGLTLDGFAGLPLLERRALVQALAVEHGHRVVSGTPRGDAFDLVLLMDLLGQPVRVLVRLVERAHRADAHEQAADDAFRSGCSTHMLLGGLGDPADVVDHPGYVSLDRLVALVEESALVSWDGQQPAPDTKGYVAWRERAEDLALADPSGLQWLRPLALNKLPADLRGSLIPPETWFEEAVFRVCTRALRLRGRRLGAQRSGRREPDGFFVYPDGQGVALFDTKAARDGFEMTAAEERKQIEYASRPWTWQGQDLPALTVVMVSSSFPTADRAFADRRTALRRAGSDLVYLSADALLALALPLLTDPDGPEAALLVDYAGFFAAGVVTEQAAGAVAVAALGLARAAREQDEVA